MKIAIDISPLSSGHSIRGVGSYVSLIRDNIQKYDKENTYIFFSDKEIPKSVDLVHFPYFDPFFPVLPFNKKKKTVVTVHDLIPIVHKRNFPAGVRGKLKWLYNKQLLKKVEAVVTDSAASKEDIVKFAGIDETKVEVVYLAADPDFRPLSLSKTEKEATLKKYSIPDRFFLYVGDVTWNKNLPRIINAFKKSEKTLVMVGKALIDKDFDKSNPWNKDRLKVMKMIDGDSKFITTGYVSVGDLAKLYNLAVGLIMPSLDEGFGLPVLEAMSSKCPVITSREGSLHEVGGEAVLYVDPRSENSISNAINDLDENLRLKESLIEKGLKQSGSFSVKKTILDLVSVYKNVSKIS